MSAAGFAGSAILHVGRRRGWSATAVIRRRP
jgi:hypothetical protein